MPTPLLLPQNLPVETRGLHLFGSRAVSNIMLLLNLSSRSFSVWIARWKSFELSLIAFFRFVRFPSDSSGTESIEIVFFLSFLVVVIPVEYYWQNPSAQKCVWQVKQ